MSEGMFDVSFVAEDRRKSLVAARKFVNALVGAVSLERGENVRADGAIYVLVHGDADTINVLLLGVAAQGVVVEVTPAVASEGVECVNCGNISDHPFTRCPACHFHEVAPCPSCGTESARTAYLPAEGTLQSCPRCHTRVRLTYADPMTTTEGYYSQPLILVERA